MNENIKSNLNELFKKNNLSTYDVAKKIGVSQPSVMGWLKKGTISNSSLAKISAAFNVPIESIINNNIRPIKTRKIPVLSWVQAGEWTSMSEDLTYDEYIDTDDTIDDDCFALRVNGTSMESNTGGKSIPEGAIVIVKPCTYDPEQLNHKVVIAINNGDATMKELILDGSIPYLKPWNNAFSLIKITESTKIIGKVIRYQCDL